MSAPSLHRESTDSPIYLRLKRTDPFLICLGGYGPAGGVAPSPLLCFQRRDAAGGYNSPLTAPTLKEGCAACGP